MKKHHSGFISSQTKSGQAEKEKKKSLFQFVSTRIELEHSQKNSRKIQKIKKHLSSFISSQIGLGQVEIEKKINSFQFIPTRPKLEHSLKIAKRINKKKIIMALFLDKTGQDRLRKRQKNFRFNFRSYLTRLEHSQKYSKN